MAQISRVLIDDIELVFDVEGLADDYIGRMLLAGQLYEAANLRYIRSLAIPFGSVYIDIGAFIGTHTIYFGRCCGAREVYAFEPNPKAFALLEHNIALNSISAVSIALGLGRVCSATASIINVPADNMGGARLVETGGVLKSTSLDEAFDGAHCDVMKIDVEGAELEVLHGADATLRRCKPLHVFVESWPELTCRARNNPYVRPLVAEFLRGRGYAFVKQLDEDLCHFAR